MEAKNLKEWHCVAVFKLWHLEFLVPKGLNIFTSATFSFTSNLSHASAYRDRSAIPNFPFQGEIKKKIL